MTSDAREWTTGVKIRQIAPSAISGSYTFEMHQSRHITLLASVNPHPKGAAAEERRLRPTFDPTTDMNESRTAPFLEPVLVVARWGPFGE